MSPKKIIGFALGPFVSAALGFITLPIIAWFYSTEDIGRIAMLQVTVSFSTLFFCLGLDQAYVREYHETESKPALLKAALLPGLILLVIIVSVLLFWPGFISIALFAIDSVLLSVLVVICLLATFVSRFLSLILRMQERGLAFSMGQILPKLLVLGIVSVYALFSFGFDLLHLVIANTVAIIIATVVHGWNTRQHWLQIRDQVIDYQKLKTMLAFGMPLILGGLAFWGLLTMDRLFLRSLSTFEQLGIYSVATSIAAAGAIFQVVFSTVWAPIVYKWVAEGINPEKIDQVIAHALAVVVFLFVLTGLFSWLINYLLPDTYITVQYIVVTCIAYPLLYTLSETTVVGVGITRKSFYAMLASVIAMLTNLLGNYLLVPRFGAAGAAVSTALAFWVFFFCRTEFSSRVWRPIPRMRLYTNTLICLTMAIGFTLFGADNHSVFIGLWLLLLLVACVVFRSSFVSAWIVVTSLNKTRA